MRRLIPTSPETALKNPESVATDALNLRSSVMIAVTTLPSHQPHCPVKCRLAPRLQVEDTVPYPL